MSFNGCTDHACIYLRGKPRTGMGTNGGCRCDPRPLLREYQQTFDQVWEALQLALNFQVSNRGTADAFYTCYTMTRGKMPEWVTLAEKALAAMEDAGR